MQLANEFAETANTMQWLKRAELLKLAKRLLKIAELVKLVKVRHLQSQQELSRLIYTLRRYVVDVFVLRTIQQTTEHFWLEQTNAHQIKEQWISIDPPRASTIGTCEPIQAAPIPSAASMPHDIESLLAAQNNKNSSFWQPSYFHPVNVAGYVSALTNSAIATLRWRPLLHTTTSTFRSHVCKLSPVSCRSCWPGRTLRT